MTQTYPVFPVGVPGQAWGAAEREAWLKLQHKKRDYFNDVVSPLFRFADGVVFQYGTLNYHKFGGATYPLYAVKSLSWDEKKPMVLITGGVHGYETSGVHGALLFVKDHLAALSDRVNVLVLPCVTPWAYETINRWNPEAIDPNRSFVPAAPGCGEAAAAMACIHEHIAKSSGILMHQDLHETTDTDNSEFTPAKVARDGLEMPPWEDIPDGFYLVSDSDAPVEDFHAALIAAVEQVTHIALPDSNGLLVGEKPSQRGVIQVPGQKIGICGAHTGAKFATTTEVYPDSSRTNAEECNRAQATCVVTGINFALAHQNK